jgi:hypothetical protein
MKDRSDHRFEKIKPQTKRTMWFRGQFVPILYGHGRRNVIGSEVWVARGMLQQIGASIFAVVFFCGSVALFIASTMVRAQTAKELEGILGQAFGAALAVLAFLAGCFGILLTFRLVRGVVRSFNKVTPR